LPAAIVLSAENDGPRNHVFIQPYCGMYNYSTAGLKS